MRDFCVQGLQLKLLFGQYPAPRPLKSAEPVNLILQTAVQAPLSILTGNFGYPADLLRVASHSTLPALC